MQSSLQTFLDFAVETAYLAGRRTLGYFRSGVLPEFKSDQTPVTIADKLSEELIRGRIEARFPDQAIVGEEFGIKKSENSTYRWIIDPIDGTKSFVCGIPLYSVLLGLEIDGNVEVGAIYFPALDEMVAAATGMGCWWNGKRCRVSQTDDLEKAVISTTDILGFQKHGKQAAWDRLAHKVYHRAGWGDAYGFALVATGRIEVMIDPAMAVWDCGPMLPVLKEAGGYFGDWQGNPTIYAGEGLATTLALLPDVLRLIKEG